MPLYETRIVICDYDATIQGHIGLKQGDTVTETEELENGWGKGINSRTTQSGYFPWNYTKSVANELGEKHILPKINSRLQCFERNDLLSNNTTDAKPKKISASCCQENFQNQEEITPLNNKAVEEAALTTAGRSKNAVINTIGRSEYYEPSSDDDEGIINVGRKLLEEGEKYCGGAEIKANQTRSMIASLIVAFIVSALVFIKLHFHQEADVKISCITSAVILILLLTSVLFSLRLRCACVLVLFSLFAREGQMLFFSLITSFLLNGPITNIVYNTEQMSSALSCYSDLAVQQGAVLQQHIEETINKSTLLLKSELAKVQDISNDMNSVVTELSASLHRVKDGADLVQNAIGQLAERCKETIAASYQSCMDISTHCSNIRSVRSTDFWDKFKDAIEGRVLTPVEKAVCGELSNMCKPLEAPGTLCTFTGDILPDVGFGVNAILKEFENLQKNLGFELRFNDEKHGMMGISRNTSEIKSFIHQEIGNAFSLVFLLTNLLSLVLFCAGISFVFYKSYSYIRHYMTEDKFDNMYVTAKLKQLDNNNSKKHKMFPLKRLECRRVVDLTSPRLTKAERIAMIISSAPLFLSLLITVGIFFLNSALYHVVRIIQEVGDVQVTIEGEASTGFEIPDTGLLSKLMRACIDSFDLISRYNVTMDLSLCVPQGRKPNSTDTYIVVLLYLFTLAFVIFQAYGLRTRHKIAAIFYPGRQNERLIYLYKTLKASSMSYKRKVKRNAKLFAKENHLLADRSVLARLARVVPGLDRGLDFLHVNRQQCVNCLCAVSTQGAKCVNQGPGQPCVGVIFCITCSQEIDQLCPVCKTQLIETNPK